MRWVKFLSDRIFWNLNYVSKKNGMETVHAYTAFFEEGVAACYRRLLPMMGLGLLARDSVTRVPHLATHVLVGY